MFSHKIGRCRARSDRHRSRPAFAPQSGHHPAIHYNRARGAEPVGPMLCRLVATVKSLASPRSLLDTGSSKDFRSWQGMLKELSNPDYRKPPKPEYTLNAVRVRGAFGKYGTSCAAVVQLLLSGNVTDFSTTYDVEPASDGKTMITARFQPTG